MTTMIPFDDDPGEWQDPEGWRELKPHQRAPFVDAVRTIVGTLIAASVQQGTQKRHGGTFVQGRGRHDA